MGDVLFENERTRVSRAAHAEAGTVIRKEYRGTNAIRRSRHERAVLSRLADLPAVPRLVADEEADPYAITMADTGGKPLSRLLAGGPLSARVLSDLAVDLASAVAALHRRGVVHRDINPGNILVAGTPPRPVLIDYDLATTFVLERPGFTHHKDITGTLPYIAPEQTGRTGWPVDERADLYSLGATLYEMATGSPPFGDGDGDELRLIHDHLTRVPAPPSALNDAVTPILSAVIGRLLEKDPDRRYQSAEGVLYDLRRAQGDAAAFPLGERDFPWRLAAPARPVGRTDAIESLRQSLTDAIAGRLRTVLVSGPGGVGKTVLINELRSSVTAAGGWFVTGKSDQYRQDSASDSLSQALSALGRLLFAEPEEELAATCAHLRAAVGSNAGVIAAAVPEFARLLDTAPEVGADDPAQAQARLQRGAVEVLRAIAESRPLVVVLDDLQWAGPVPVGLLDAVLTDDRLRGVLVIGAYRESDIDSAHPLSALLSRWTGAQTYPPHVRLENLPPEDVRVMLAEMLRIPVPEAAELADSIRPHAGGNPFDTVEFVNALRCDGVLTSTDGGWTWDTRAVRRYIGSGDVLALLTRRLANLPDTARDILLDMASLGGDVELDLLRSALGMAERDDADLTDDLAPALEDGLLVLERGVPASIRFPHDRIQQAAYRSLPEAERRARHLAMARRLAEVPRYHRVAAEHYHAALADLTDPAERARAVPLLRDAAGHARLLANYALMERFLSAAADLLAAGTAPDAGPRARQEVDVERHEALFGVGRFDDADTLYERIERDRTDPILLTRAACVQAGSLMLRGRPADALQLGLGVLAELAHPAPEADELFPEIARGMDMLETWVATSSTEEDVRRGENTDPHTDAVARMLSRMLPAAFFSGSPLMAWLVTSAIRLWAAGGPCAALVGPLAHAAFVTIVVRRDYRTGHAIVERALSVSEALGYEPETSHARMLYALSAGPWFRPLEECVRMAQRAREGLLRGGDLQNAGFTFYATVCGNLECAPTLEEAQVEIDAGMSFVARTGNRHVEAFIVAYRQSARALRGETNGPGDLSDASFDEEAHLASLAANPTAAGNYHILAALVAAVFNDAPALIRHAAVGTAMMPAYEGTHATTVAQFLQALALAAQAREAGPEARAELLAEFDRYHGWTADRAAETPGNFRHLHALLDAERAWLLGDVDGALRAFDTAQHEVESRQRPWQRALVAERLGRFHLSRGLEYAGRTALREAHRHYQRWGATAKVEQLAGEFPFLRAVDEPRTDTRRPSNFRSSSAVSSQTMDIVAILRASQALSSETNLNRLQNSVNDVLCSLTGANSARLVIRAPDDGWYLPQAGQRLLLTDPAHAGLVPQSVLRYVERTQQPLVVDDATRDDRFSHDPYLAELSTCALLVVPVQSPGGPYAMLLLENRVSRSAFGTNGLEAVQLIAGQLTVSLENALVHAELERKVAERTSALEAANEQLELLAVTDPLTGLANRRRLTEFLETDWRRSLRSAAPIAIAMIDIDHFKQYNDFYGHPAGDACLRTIAGTIGRNVRETDMVTRYGGEEFAVVMPNTDEAAAVAVAERVRAAVAALAEPHERSTCGTVTISIGVAAAVPSAAVATPEQLLKSADAELYEAKRQGRNRVVSPSST
ncbi:serine/threonine protein kinase [Virgisporangium aliadipatigenens]|uniref:Serine/threonine protein kinase n=1 Tax=Virgisporangium aliadipatigenens TaxID=741659 RepID=A0A8J3YKK2_9ACTN|nr:diguanylate cyclase [Virgisporangium aliadipatigenens]GIJ46127.1 serine/threonine protein kinase [Virgisporangium aliadipatigenens]